MEQINKLSGILCESKLSQRVKDIIYIYVRSAGAESWANRDEVINRLEVTEIGML